ncbi:MAG: pseudouridine synthase [Cellulosilyticaceae bacterium]
MRLQKYLAQAGVDSRRKCEEHILAGRVQINGQVVTELGVKVEAGDQVTFDNKPVQVKEKEVYYLLNKPVGYITSVADEKNRPTVMDLLEKVDQRVFPVGRLDYNTSGLLLMTNDGALTYALTHPKHDVPKTYTAKVKGHVTGSSIAKLTQGVIIDNYLTAPAVVKQESGGGTTTTLSITIHEGKNRQVRKMCEAVGHSVLKLQRVAIGKLTIGNLEPGTYRPLTQDEVRYLKQIGGIQDAQ